MLGIRERRGPRQGWETHEKEKKNTGESSRASRGTIKGKANTVRLACESAGGVVGAGPVGGVVRKLSVGCASPLLLPLTFAIAPRHGSAPALVRAAPLSRRHIIVAEGAGRANIIVAVRLRPSRRPGALERQIRTEIVQAIIKLLYQYTCNNYDVQCCICCVRLCS